ncbi:hypothetical protein BBJ29_000537 [Phytophthora kernoviae]|uniref:Aminotransferase class V domain-containing protein n=1 Tax=Phytophthora kernoviae TaxID=325452 RepID=A0A3F2RYE5_9STRA|nr:hypothetical protein BBJ29_000537 [Phytophthora kernoviae]RLN66660.1 hypothetical protein BBP00_00002069 [Phytophthora kernoviae]
MQALRSFSSQRVASRLRHVAAASSARSFATDKRYRPVNEVPASVLDNVNSDKIFSPGFAIRGEHAPVAGGKPAYLDIQATTPMDPRVLDVMMPYMTFAYGNPHSTTHEFGWDADKAVEKARESVASLIGANSKEIIFTSGATESNNAILKGVAHFTKAKKKHIITTQIEHKCVLDSCRERGLRSGTLATPLVVGFGAACEVAVQEMENDHRWVSYLSNKLYHGITDRIEHVVLNGDLEKRYAGNMNLSFAYVEGESLLMALKNIAVSSGSACTSASLEPSYVLRAIGVGEDLAHTSIRFGIGRFTTEEEIDYAVDLCVQHVTRLREMSPLWEMVQEGIDPSTIQWSQDAH